MTCPAPSSQDELAELVEELRAVILSRTGNGPAPDRALHLLSPILFPIEFPIEERPTDHPREAGTP
ncbi:hypothetical protein ACFVT5_15595 [Streptomyces sp. NPDC058001]|uniref:hypothetical protein n=1 Tax=Streptomyces sp. NPDC058001 TaxID=3346300 RepID=UPI0036EFF504